MRDIEECTIKTLLVRHSDILYANFHIGYNDACRLVRAFDSGGMDKFWRVVEAINNVEAVMK